MRQHAASLLLLISALGASAQETKSAWKSVQVSSGVTEISARSEISPPQAAGFATLKIRLQRGVNPPAIVYLIIESPERLPHFPFDKYDGPIYKTKNEFITFEVSSESNRSIRVMPNGFYGVTPQGAFIFDTIDKGVVSFLSKLKDGERLTVTVNGSPSPIQVTFYATGLKQILDQLEKSSKTTTPRLSH